MTRFLFPRELRLLTSPHFVHVFQYPQQQVRMSQITVLSRLNSLEYPRIGIILSKKDIKHAYERNRIKRLIRENFRLHQYELPLMDFIIIAKKKVVNFNNRALSEELGKLWCHHRLLSRGF